MAPPLNPGAAQRGRGGLKPAARSARPSRPHQQQPFAKGKGKATPPSAPAPATSNDDASSSSGEEEEEEEEEPFLLERTELSLSSHPLPALGGMTATLSQFGNLHKLDLSSLQPSDDNPQGLTSLVWLSKAIIRGQRAVSKRQAKSAFGDSLTWLNLSSNAKLDDAGTEGLESFKTLFVLNLSHCALTTLPSSISPLKTLKALVLNNNGITTLPSSFPHLPELNTLILSHNGLTSLPSTLPAAVPALKKLSISHNDLSSPSCLPDLSTCLSLREVRMTSNKRLGSLPPHLQRWGKGADGKSAFGLEVLECGDCGLADLDAIAPLLVLDAGASSDDGKQKKGLANLSLRGNGVTALDGYKDRLTDVHATLKVLDNERIVAKVHPVSREQKRQEARLEARMQRSAGVQGKDCGYANIRAKRDGMVPQGPSSAAAGASDEDDDDDEAAQMAEEMRRRRRQMDVPAPSAPTEGRNREKDGKARAHPVARPHSAAAVANDEAKQTKKKHKRGGARVRKSNSTTASHASLTDRSSTSTALKSSFFEPVTDESPRRPPTVSAETKKASKVKEGVHEDTTSFSASTFAPSSLATTPQDGQKRKRAARSGKKRRELDMDLHDEDADASSTTTNVATTKNKEKLNDTRKVAWDATSPSLYFAHTTKQSTIQPPSPPQQEQQQQSSVAKIIDLSNKRKRSTDLSSDQANRKENKKLRMPFHLAAASDKVDKSDVIGTGADAWGGSGNAWD